MSGILLATVGNSYGSAPVNTVAPAVTGTASFGSTLTTTNGTWLGAPAPTFTYQWQRVTTNISGATSSTYVLVAADVGNTIRCVVKATNSVAPSGVTANSNSTASVAAIVPGAPTIGTATQTGSSTATVAYTAPANDGGATITSYTATSSPAGGTGTLSQAGSGTITVTGLSPLTSYTFTVTATNSVGTGAASAASNSITTALPAIGAAFGGGYFAGQISTSGNGTANYNLVVGPIASAYNSALNFKTSNSNDPGTLSLIDGPGNSASINNSAHPAAEFCEDLTIGGYSDWYLPAINEIEVCYFNLKPTTTSNYTDGAEPFGVPIGSNANAVPSRSSAYTSGNPAQTSATNFQTGNTEAYLLGKSYWSSTQSSVSTSYARTQRFSDGYQYQNIKNHPNYGNRKVRAIRRVAV
jgi:hypothetical protein